VEEARHRLIVAEKKLSVEQLPDPTSVTQPGTRTGAWGLYHRSSRTYCRDQLQPLPRTNLRQTAKLNGRRKNPMITAGARGGIAAGSNSTSCARNLSAPLIGPPRNAGRRAICKKPATAQLRGRVERCLHRVRVHRDNLLTSPDGNSMSTLKPPLVRSCVSSGFRCSVRQCSDRLRRSIFTRVNLSERC
jgi:hypothetical protein